MCEVCKRINTTLRSAQRQHFTAQRTMLLKFRAILLNIRAILLKTKRAKRKKIVGASYYVPEWPFSCSSFSRSKRDFSFWRMDIFGVCHTCCVTSMNVGQWQMMTPTRTQRCSTVVYPPTISATMNDTAQVSELKIFHRSSG